MKINCIVPILLSLILSLTGCGILSNRVKINEFKPIGEVNKLTTFTIEFSKDLAPSDIQNQWLSDEFIQFKPKIEGKFKWVSASTLVFSPDYQLQPIQSYTAKITNKVLFNTKFSTDFEDYEFHTPDFEAFKVEYFWTQLPNENYKLSVKANLYFTYPVNPGSLKNYLIVQNKGEILLNYQIVTESASDVIALNIGDISQTDKEQNLEVIIKKGLLSLIGKKPIQNERKFNYTLPPITKLAITDVQSGYADQRGWIEVSTTQKVDDKKLKSFINLEPAKNLEFFVNDNSFRIEGDFSESQLLKLKILKGLPGLYGGQLEFDYEQDIALANIQPALNFSDSKGRYLLLSGNRNIEVKSVNIPSVNIEVSQVFKNNILFFLHNYDYYGSENDSENEEYDYQPEYEAGDYGRPFYHESVSLKNVNNKLEKFNINLDRVFKEKQKGIFVSFIAISKFPAIQFSKQLRDLVGYPHGCVEQTVSKLFPQLYFDDLAKLVAPENYRNNNPVYFVKEGIRKLVSMQLWDGSLSYWPGGAESSWWGSVYAAHFLVEAKKAGFDVPDNMLQKLLGYIEKKAKEKHTFGYVTYLQNSRTVTLLADKEILYSLYVLALAGKSDISTMNYYKNRLNLVPNDSRYHLAGAYALAGKWNSYYELIPSSFREEKTERLSGGSFDSDIRANALMLNVLLEIEPSNKQVPFIIRYLSGRLKEIYSTQETAFALLALGKAAKLTSNSNVKVDLSADKNSIGSFNGKDINIPLDINTSTLSFKTSGQGEVYYFQNTQGVKSGEVKEVNSHMKVTRTYYDCRTKSVISGNRFYQGQMIACRITLQGYNIQADNIAVTDLLPAGFEIENPRLANTQQQDWKSTLNVKYMDIRDDRLILFTNVENNTRDYYYFIRVVNKGKFQLPVISAEAMYQPEIKSITGRGMVVVNEFVR